MRTAVLVFLTHKIALPVLKHIRRPGEVAYSQEELGLLPPGTLGHDLFLFLEERNLPLLPHYMRHDLKHVLLEYDTTAEGEACLQCCMLGTGRISFPVLATVGFALLTMPEYWNGMRVAFRKGRKAVFFHHWPWSGLLSVPTVDLRNRIF
ncbi:MAG: hypothetical protein NTW29_16485 [Bacteroidetes bacterium]|nr:hypothetical protein [Bacteroidota bacterium]